MDEAAIKEHLEALMRRETDDEAAKPHFIALAGAFLVNQHRIATALEKLAGAS